MKSEITQKMFLALHLQPSFQGSRVTMSPIKVEFVETVNSAVRFSVAAYETHLEIL